MIKRLTFILSLLVSSQTTWSQVIITGKVISKIDETPIPLVRIVEKGTSNGTTADIDGTFSIKVADPNSTLVFSFIGMITKEYQLKGQRHIIVEAKWDCHKDFFDSNEIKAYANSGLINTPLGGQIEVATPYLFFGGVVKGSYSYQTNLDQTELQNGQIEFSHFISTCDFDMDFKWNYRQVNFNNDFNSKAYSFEADYNLRNVKLIAGYTHLSFDNLEAVGTKTSSGVLIGFGTTLGQPLHPTVIGKVSFYMDNIEYQASVQGGYKGILFFTKFYKLNSFNELSLGIGTAIGYRIKRREK
ncbi:carboxypeptidase-like regulatory domain-containing protein [Pontibacter flavimaris]|uniref:carboxypeptidase-like regulatory domain-containing protein n=1 Tax=Pontibacter flavimaris TaxID=1797110 RepID=UPI00147CEAD4|nr:carboxypeptidase-like regulatory domain-containing protein [Pontibacter flavimaris]